MIGIKSIIHMLRSRSCCSRFLAVERRWPTLSESSRKRAPLSTGFQQSISTSISGGSSSSSSSPTNGHKYLTIQDNIQQALVEGKPVVALESTIVAHGMPFPQNLQLALEVEDILLGMGVVPATIAVKDGICQVGLTTSELEDLARAGQEGRAQKCSTRDLPIIIAKATATTASSSTIQSFPRQQQQQHYQWGATTVASTMRIAHLAGISTFVTGGIGGVHKNGETSMDISADLTELGQTPVVVVSAGIKSILDIQRTMEVLETNSVPTMGWRTDEFPAFFSPKSGVACPARVDDAESVAAAYWVARHLRLPQGMLVAVPNHDPAGANVERAIQEAFLMAEEQGIRGQAVTPFILKTVAEKTGGDSLRSNMALVRQNARVGAEIAIAISRIRSGDADAAGHK
jgi:pseudouridine-5'-phosphate glycosidase